MKTLDRVRIGFSPLSGTLYLYRHGKDPRTALEKRKAEADVMAAVRDYMLYDAPKGSEMEFRIGEQWYRIRLEPIATPDTPSPLRGDERG